MRQESQLTLNEALDAVAALVGQFAYPTKFCGKPALWHGGLSALEEAFSVLESAGCKVNSNGTIQEADLDKFMERLQHEREADSVQYADG